MRDWKIPALSTAAATTLFLLATGCGTSDPAPTAAPPTSTAPSAPASGTSGENSDPAPTSVTVRDQAWAAVDPCKLLQPAQLKPFLANTPAKPSRADADGKHVCAWGDGEFRSVRLSVWQPASTDELAKDAVRQVSVGGREAHVVRDAEYTCEIQVGDQRMAVNLQAVTTDKVELCGDTTTALTAVVSQLHW
ncbi:DUF3558 family protein [Labedaea rhizosphaerae]|uniref:DUF3558 family protein n=1 Tax=Labedaea rhizosphaerae TaxID=598644 RepID=UPI001414FA4D|nr:DUF3558 family protein [Labedaea rhizosphaerae]